MRRLLDVALELMRWQEKLGGAKEVYADLDDHETRVFSMLLHAFTKVYRGLYCKFPLDEQADLYSRTWSAFQDQKCGRPHACRALTSRMLIGDILPH